MCSHYFLFRNNFIRGQLDQNDLRRCFGNFFSKVSFCKYLITAMLKVLSEQLQDTLTTAFERHPPIEDFTDMDRQRCRACTKTFDLLCASFSQTNLDFEFNLTFVTIYLLFYLSIFCTFWSSSSTTKLFSWKPITFWWGSMLFFEKVYSHKMLFFYIPQNISTC